MHALFVIHFVRIARVDIRYFPRVLDFLLEHGLDFRVCAFGIEIRLYEQIPALGRVKPDVSGAD